MAVTIAADINHAATRMNSAASTVLALAAWFRPMPTTKACAGRATTSKKATTKLMLSVVKRHQRGGITTPAKAPARAAVIGVGMIFKATASRDSTSVVRGPRIHRAARQIAQSGDSIPLPRMVAMEAGDAISAMNDLAGALSELFVEMPTA